MKPFIVVSSGFLVLAAASLWEAAGAQGDDGWGTVKGRIVWEGEIPKRKPIDSIDKHADKAHCLSKGIIVDEDWVVNAKNKGLRWTFVWLADAKNPKARLPIHPDLKEIKIKELVMDQPCCMFTPHALGLREGQVLVAKNSSPIPHNFNWHGRVSKGVSGNVLVPAKGTFPIKGLPADPLPVLIQCNVHTWMKGYVRVFDHPYFAVTDENGAFKFLKAPSGDYRLVVWHGSGGWSGGAAGKNGQPIAIKANAPTNLGDMVYKKPPD